MNWRPERSKAPEVMRRAPGHAPAGRLPQGDAERDLRIAAVRAAVRHRKPWPVIRHGRIAIADNIRLNPHNHGETLGDVYISDPVDSNREAQAACQIYLGGLNVGSDVPSRLRAAMLYASAQYAAARRRCCRHPMG